MESYKAPERPDAFHPDLALSLNNLAALKASREAEERRNGRASDIQGVCQRCKKEPRIRPIGLALSSR